MRYQSQQDAESWVVIDTWYHDPEKKGASNTFSMCRCHLPDSAEKIAKALNQYDEVTFREE